MFNNPANTMPNEIQQAVPELDQASKANMRVFWGTRECPPPGVSDKERFHRNPLDLQGNTLSSCTERRSMKRFAGSSDCHDAVLNRYISPNKENGQAQEARTRGSNQATNPARLQDGGGAASEIRAARFCVNHRHTLPLCAEECG